MERSIRNVTFSDLINERINEGMVNANRLIVNSLEEKNIPISMRSLQKYRKGDRVPAFLVAKEILRVLNIPISDSELADVLENSRGTDPEFIEKNYSSFNRKEEKRTSTKRRVTVDLNKIDVGSSLEILSQVLNDRLIELYGDDNKLSDYIHDLIKADLINGVLGEDQDQ